MTPQAKLLSVSWSKPNEKIKKGMPPMRRSSITIWDSMIPWHWTHHGPAKHKETTQSICQDLADRFLKSAHSLKGWVGKAKRGSAVLVENKTTGSNCAVQTGALDNPDRSINPSGQPLRVPTFLAHGWGQSNCVLGTSPSLKSKLAKSYSNAERATQGAAAPIITRKNMRNSDRLGFVLLGMTQRELPRLTNKTVGVDNLTILRPESLNHRWTNQCLNCVL